MNDGLLYPTLAEVDNHEESQQMEDCNEDKTPSHSDIFLKPESECKRREQYDNDQEKTKNNCQGGGRNQAHHLVNHIKFDVFCL